MNRTEAPILIVDDDEDDRALILDSLKAAGVSIPLRTLANGREAIDYLSGSGPYRDRARFPPPCLLLLDIKMPLADGFDVLRWLRQETRNFTLPVLMLSGSAHGKDIERALELGANAFLVKPLVLDDMVRMMRAVKEFWLCCHAPRPLDEC